jgi:hypothetical protein
MCDAFMKSFRSEKTALKWLSGAQADVIYKPLDFYGLSVNIVGAHAID